MLCLRRTISVCKMSILQLTNTQLQNFRLRKDLLLHLKTTHVIEINKDKTNKTGKHECYICNQEFSSYGSLAYHMSKHQGISDK